MLFLFRGVSSAELLAVELKTLGLYLSRHVGFEGVKFSQITVPMTAEFKRIYKLSSEIVSQQPSFGSSSFFDTNYFIVAETSRTTTEPS